ncbi:MAG: hypothetical protein ACKVOK_02605 [Flavobacteriales bacterium]
MNHVKFAMLVLAVIFASCKKESETVTFSGNTIPPYDEISTLLVENYVNRLFIDLTGREPTDAEMALEVAALEAGELSTDVRGALVDKIMTSAVYIEGDSSLKHAFYQKIYDDHKGRFLNGASESEMNEMYYLYYFISVQDSMAGNMLAYEINRNEANKMKTAINSRVELMNGNINIKGMCRRMCFNPLYDEINMNTFNYINATFDDLFYRFPTEAELDQAFEPVDYNASGILFGEVINSKEEYLNLLLDNSEFGEGMIRWAYISLLGREPSSIEIYNVIDNYNTGQNIQFVLKSILITDEYAGFQ